ncbi:MAG: C_GCAxxG_C_C family protein [Bacteroidales bacterium]|nr:C_GCAxxG_C_C family protein [Bacteroidales bacterium]
MEKFTQRAVELFKQGYSCSQSVAGAYAEYYKVDKDLILRIASSFGAGIGRMRETCGAACGMFILAGLECGSTDPKDAAGKGANYKVVQELAAEFKRENGSLICAELLGLRPMAGEKEGVKCCDNGESMTSPTPQERNAEYYKKRPCVEMVETAARIYGNYLSSLTSKI